jgi:hypothetical protein
MARASELDRLGRKFSERDAIFSSRIGREKRVPAEENEKNNIENEGESHDVVDNKGSNFITHDVIDNKGTYPS